MRVRKGVAGPRPRFGEATDAQSSRDAKASKSGIFPLWPGRIPDRGTDGRRHGQTARPHMSDGTRPLRMSARALTGKQFGPMPDVVLSGYGDGTEPAGPHGGQEGEVGAERTAGARIAVVQPTAAR